MARKHTNNEEICDLFLISPEIKRFLAFHEGYDLFYLKNSDSGYWKLLSPEKMAKIIFHFIRSNKLSENITENTIRDVVFLVKMNCPTVFREEALDYIAFNDCIFDLKTFTTHPLTFADDKMITFHIPVNYEDTLSTPEIFENFLKTSLCVKPEGFSPTSSVGVSDPDWPLISLVQEMMGYFMMGATPHQVAFFLVGDGSNGKSVLANLIRDILGPTFCSAMTIESLTTDKFQAAHLIGKKVNISNEEESKFIKSDRFKAIITHDMINAQYKFGKSFEFIPTTKFLFCSNSLPTFENLNYGLRRRIQIIPFFRIFERHEQDTELPQKLRKELPKIVGWALEGAQRLVLNNFKFTIAGSSEQAKKEFEEEISASVRFIRENYDIDDENFTSNADLYEHFKSWCNQNGKKPINFYGFGKEIFHNIKGLKNKCKRDGYEVKNGKNIYPKNSNNIIINEEESDVLV